MNTHTCKHIDAHIYFPNFLQNWYFNYKEEDFLGGSAGKESACDAGDLGSIPGLGRSPGERKGYPLQYSGLENSMGYPWGHKESDMTEQLSLHFTSLHFQYL